MLIYRLCGKIIDLIDVLQCHDKDLNNSLEWLRGEIADIREDIDNC